MSTVEKSRHIDIPVKLAEVKVAFSVPALSFEGDLAASIFHLQLIENDIADKGPGHCGLSHECGPRDVERQVLQHRPECGDRQSVQSARR
jgi:hypothetical protein